MAFVTALQQGWPTDNLKFKSRPILQGSITMRLNISQLITISEAWLILSMMDRPALSCGNGSPRSHSPMQEKFALYVCSFIRCRHAESHQIGSVPTPWPSWMIAAHPARAPHDRVRHFLKGLTSYVREFDSREKRASANVEFIKSKFGYPVEDIEVYIQLEITSTLLTMLAGVAKNCGISGGLLSHSEQSDH